MINLINKKKISSDNYISVLLVISYLAFVVIFRLEWIMSVIVYPFVALLFTGLLMITGRINKKNRRDDRSVLKILLGFFYMIFSVLFLFFILSQPNVKARNIINLTAFPIFIVGIAGIVKGFNIDIYSLKHRISNIIIGFVTLVVCIFAFSSPTILPNIFYRLHFITLSLVLILNIM